MLRRTETWGLGPDRVPLPSHQAYHLSLFKTRLSETSPLSFPGVGATEGLEGLFLFNYKLDSK